MKFKLPFGLTGIYGYLAVGLLILALLASIIFGVRSCKEIDQSNKNVLINSGVTAERSAEQTKVIHDVSEAQNAIEHPTKSTPQ